MDRNNTQQQSAKIFESKKKSEEAIAKYEKKKKHLLKVQKVTLKTPHTSDLALITASQLGVLKATLISKANTEVNKALQRFINTCPPPATLSRVVKIKDNLNKTLNKYQKSVRTFSTIATTLNTAISLVKTYLKARYLNPKPVAVGGVGIPIGIINLSSDEIYKLNKKLDEYSEQVKTISALIEAAQTVVNPIQEKLLTLDSYVERCTLQDTVNLEDTFKEIVQQGTSSQNQNKEVYKGYALSIVTDPDTAAIAPKRYAIAQDIQEVVVLRGPSSFSSDTQVLLDELKFRIDNQLS
jgi:prophage DNA circulation protein